MRRMFVQFHWRTALAVVLVPILLSGAASSAHAQGATAAIQGTITDSQGGVLPGVSVAVRNVDAGTIRTTVSEADGRYRVPALPPGRYDLSAELPGFVVAEAKGVTLTIGLDLRRDFTLGLETLQEAITVSGAAPSIETTKAEVAAAVITRQQIDSLPIEGRQTTSLSLLMPGTGTDSTRAKRPNANVGAGGIGISSTNYLADGMSNMISRGGDPRDNISQEAIQEFRVIVSQAPAEYGGRTGGVVSVVTKSGTNRFSGVGFEFFRHKNLNRMDRFQQEQHDQLGTPKPDFRRDQFGGAFGGPLVRDRLHFFFSYERTDEQEFFNVNTGRPELYSGIEGTFRGGSLANAYFGRVDAQITPQQHAFFRYFEQDTTYFCDGCGGTRAAFSAGNTGVPSFTYLGGHTWVLSPRVLNELTLMYAESFNNSALTDYTPAQFRADGSPSYNFPSASWGFRPGTQFHNFFRQVRNTVTVSTGRHTWKAGGGAIILPASIFVPGNTLGSWTFGTDQYFNPADPAFSLAGLTNPILFTGSTPDNYQTTMSHTYEAFVQDEWRPFANLTLNAGLRYDRQTKIWNEGLDQSRYPRPLPYVDFASRGDANNFAPRAGLAWDVRGNGRSLVKAGYGLVYTNIQNGWFDGEISAFRQNAININNPSYPDPFQGRDPASFVSTAPPNITIAANDLVNPPAHTASVGFSQELRDGLALHVDGLYTRTSRYPANVQVNTRHPVTLQRPLPEWNRIVQSTGVGTFDYRALLLRLDKRYANRHQYMVSYTLAKQDNNWAGGSTSAGIGSITDFYNPGLDEGPANNDRRHVLAASGSVLLPLDVTLGAVWSLRSSTPFSALAGRDLNGDGSNTDYVPGTTRNQGNRGLDLGLVNAWRASNGLGAISPDQIDTNTYNRVDVRASKALRFGDNRRLELIGQVFNLFGSNNLGGVGTDWVTNALSSSFGRILSAQPRQRAELAVRVVF